MPKNEWWTRFVLRVFVSLNKLIDASASHLLKSLLIIHNITLTFSVRQISRYGLLFETYLWNWFVSKVIPAWCRFLRKQYVTRRSHWRVWPSFDTYHGCCQCNWRIEVHWTRQFDWRVELGLLFTQCRVVRSVAGKAALIRLKSPVLLVNCTVVGVASSTGELSLE